jgi:hypothetical protein
MVVELEPQEDAMLRSRSLLCADDTLATPSTLYEHFVLLAALGVLIASPPPVSGQTDNPSESSKQANPQAQICDGLRQGDPHLPSLSIAKPHSPDDGPSVAEQQSAPQSSSEPTGEAVQLPEIKSSSRVTQEEVLRCAKPNMTKPVQPDDPSPETDQSPQPARTPTIPIVSYAGGELTIHAENVPLRDVLEAIQARAGITVEFPQEAMEDSVFDHVGPVPAQAALAQLLYGSGYNYVIQTSSQDPQVVTKLVLSAQTHVASASPPQHPIPPKNEQADNQALYGNNTQVAIEPIPPVPAASTLIGIPTGFNVQQAATTSGKTPGQILDELQKHQLQVLDDQSPPQ